MKMLNAWTLELDDAAMAVAEVLEQLDLAHNALAHSVGFITCSYDYVEAGMVTAICDALPFDVVGCTTLTNATNGEAGTMLLCLSVLTADDCRFSTAVSAPLGQDLQAAVDAAAGGAAQALGESVRMALAFFPMFGVGGEIMLTALDESLGGIPIFGTIGCDFDTADYRNTFTIHNGRHYKDCMSFLLMSGNVTPRFVVTATSEQNLKKQQAVITASEGSLLKQVNNMPAAAYFESIGIVSGRGLEGLSSVPFVVDYNDGTQPVARAIYGLNEDGSAVCGGVMPEGSTLSIGRMDVSDILLTAETSMRRLLDAGVPDGIVLFPCLGRNMVLSMDDPLAETAVVDRLVGDAAPWHLAYSGGEVCPVYTAEGGTVNRFHNFTFIGCAFYS